MLENLVNRYVVRKSRASRAAQEWHLDSKCYEHHAVMMRTTVTLDPDAERLLRNAMHSRRKSMKQTLNDAIRAGLGAKSKAKDRPRFVVKARPMGLRAGLDPTSMNKLADELEVDAVLAKGRRGMRG
jgi:hypothetical protein